MNAAKGLKGVVAVETSISSVDGKNGILLYRGLEISEVMKIASFEKAAYFLWYGKWPDDHELSTLKNELSEHRMLSSEMKKLIDGLPKNMDMMSVIRTAVSSEGTVDYSWKPTIGQAIRLTAQVPSIIAYRKRTLEGNAPISPDPDLSHVENYLYMLYGSLPLKAHADALEAYMILTLEHGMNASTFAARVTASTESDLVSAATSAIGTMKGPLHGGAPSGVIDLLNEISEANDIEKVLRHKLTSGEKLMGFGHRVYKTHDPRALALKERLLQTAGEDPWLDLALETERMAVELLKEYKPGRSLYTNVEFYAAAIMKAIQMEPDLFTPTFTASRMVGWSAHVLEQAEDNTIFRPESVYVGPDRSVAGKTN
ncbi:citrate synthase/methylcitrate synthase [Fictibacillus enclensis]|uniref:citrate synthase/methylcitrate synthase n=1 Tax=Fictibacillus enclensis TaxID=1017270 RepID=UPI0025A1A760|nr:citrate synthase/methylcitrate synthase [Fictibacillus enclensis]MDM5340013.1 citrate synthase/methylcitrate synthase [Fictibacillus enclensis]